jgi:hypothetical protein
LAKPASQPASQRIPDSSFEKDDKRLNGYDSGSLQRIKNKIASGRRRQECQQLAQADRRRLMR